MDRVRGERVALKVLHGHLAGASAQRRLQREVRAAGALRHPGILTPHDLYPLGEGAALSLPVHEGRTLDEVVRDDGPLPEEELRTLLARIGGALRCAHDAGVIHRDVTPKNILVDDQGPVLTDFGLARTTEAHHVSTRAMGTSGYAAPETYRGQRADPRSDVYSLGAVLYFAATGGAPFAAPTAMGVLQRQLEGTFTPLSVARPELSPELAAAISRMLDRDLAVRPTLDEAMALELRPTAPPRKTWLWSGVGALLALVLLFAAGVVQDGVPALLVLVDGSMLGPALVTSNLIAAFGMLPLALGLAGAGAALGLRQAHPAPLAPWVSVALLAVLVAGYSALATLVIPGFVAGRPRSVVVFSGLHQLSLWVLGASVLLGVRPWRYLRGVVEAPRRIVEHTDHPLVSGARADLAALLRALDAPAVPEAVRVDLRSTVAGLVKQVDTVEAELERLPEALARKRPELAEQQDLSAELARLRTLDSGGRVWPSSSERSRPATHCRRTGTPTRRPGPARWPGCSSSPPWHGGPSVG